MGDAGGPTRTYDHRLHRHGSDCARPGTPVIVVKNRSQVYHTTHWEPNGDGMNASRVVVDYALLDRSGQIRRLRKVAMRALLQYGIEPVSLSLLQHQYNSTFLVSGLDAARYVLHISRPHQRPTTRVAAADPRRVRVVVVGSGANGPHSFCP